MTTSAQQIRAWQGPAILSYGYRPFFLLGAVWAALAMVLWVMALAGAIDWAGPFDAVTWHAHAMLFGYPLAVIAGFLMTAVPNWTGRFPIVGWPLLGLVALWLAGRVVTTLPMGLSPVAVAAVDLGFAVGLALAIGREIVAGRNWRNLKVLGVLAVQIVAGGLFHWEAARGDYAPGGIGARLGLAAVVVLIALIGGRIVPSFTRNWLVKRRARALPAPMGRLDDGAMAVTIVAAGLWVIWPDQAVTGLACLIAGAVNLLRLARWQGQQTGAEALVWVLHAGFAFVPLGFLALGAEALGLIAIGPAARHVWMAGAIGVMTLAVMSRASLGHAGLPLAAGRGVAGLYLAVIGSVLARVAAGVLPGLDWLLHLAGAAWVAGFGGFAVLYWPILTRPRADRRRPN